MSCSGIWRLTVPCTPSFCDLFLCGWVCSCLKGPTKFVCDASAFPFSVFEVLLSEEPLQVQVALGRVPLALLRLS